MKNDHVGQMSGTAALSAVIGVVATLGFTAGAFAASDGTDGPRPKVVRAGRMRPAVSRPLTVRLRPNRPASVARGDVERPDDDFVFRDWNDTRLRTLYGFRFGGNVFYGDNRGDPINYGNATLAGISGYGAARGGFGGPHFDSVGGFHQGPGPDDQESLDYASGRIWTPDYEVPPPPAPSLGARVAALNTGLVPRAGASGRPAIRLAAARVARPAPSVPATLPAPPRGDDEEEARPATADDIFPDFGIDGL